MITSRIDDAKKLLAEEKKRLRHREFKKIICELTNSDPYGAIPDELKTTQIAALACPESGYHQKIIAYALSPQNKKMDSFEMIEAGFLDVMQNLNLQIPDILRWWIDGARPENVPIEKQQNDAPPVQQVNAPKAKVSINQDRDNDCKAWIETEKPPLDNMTRRQVHDALIARNRKLWSHGFSDWCRQQKIITFKTGKPKKQRLNPLFDQLAEFSKPQKD